MLKGHKLIVYDLFSVEHLSRISICLALFQKAVVDWKLYNTQEIVVMLKAGVRIMDDSPSAPGDCMDAGGRVTQEQLPRWACSDLR